MSFRIVLIRAAFGLLLVVGAADTAGAQVRVGRRADLAILDERSFLADFRTIYECLERVLRDDGLAIEFSGSGSSWSFSGSGGGANQAFVVVADERKFPLLKDRALAHLAGHIPGPNPNGAEPRKVVLDLDTGELTSPEGVDVSGWRITRLQLHVTLTQPGAKESCHINVAREFPGQHIKVSISGRPKDGEDSRRDLLPSLESKLKLASKLSEAKKKARRAEHQEMRASDPKANGPMPTSPEKPRSLGSPG
jgi:hypothetical protein